MRTRLLLAALTLSFLVAAPVSAETWMIGPADGKVGFKVKNLAGWVNGVFDDFGASVEYDPADPTSAKVDVMIITSSINTKNKKRDDHLRSDDFLDSANHPQMTFKSSSVAVVEGGLAVTGTLSIRGFDKEIVLMVVGPTDEVVGDDGKTRRSATASVTVQRVDFGMDWKIKGALVGPDVFITIDAAMRKKG